MHPTVTNQCIRLLTSGGENYTVDWSVWQPEERCVLCVIHHGGKLLLIRKKSGFGTGKITVPGGHIEDGESAWDAAIRETIEEVGLTPVAPRHVGDINFDFTSGYKMYVAIFMAKQFKGTLTESDEATPFWQPDNSIPYQDMWADDRIWLPTVLRGGAFRADFVFEEDTGLSLWHQMIPGVADQA